MQDASAKLHGSFKKGMQGLAYQHKHGGIRVWTERFIIRDKDRPNYEKACPFRSVTGAHKECGHLVFNSAVWTNRWRLYELTGEYPWCLKLHKQEVNQLVRASHWKKYYPIDWVTIPVKLVTVIPVRCVLRSQHVKFIDKEVI